MRSRKPAWGFLADRLDHRIAVSRAGARVGTALAARRLRDRAERRAHPAARRSRRPRAPRRLRRPPREPQRTARPAAGVARDPPAHRRHAACLRRRPAARAAADDAAPRPGRRHRRARLPAAGQFTEELLAAKALIAPSLGGESFGIVLTRALACATPVVASDIPGYRDVMTPETGLAFPPGDVAAHGRGRVDARGRASPPGDGCGRRAARRGALHLGRDCASTRRDLRLARRMKLRRPSLPRSNVVRVAISLAFMAG